jgi:predicted RNA-binding Zn-ribbon protein involved in translation (DUF1610 family)
MNEKTLKGLLEPPFAVHGHRTSDGYVSFDLNYPAWCYGEELEDAAREFAEQALTEKWEHDFCEPMRWEIVTADNVSYLSCPVCNRHIVIDNQGIDMGLWRHCPQCGKRLKSPEEK